MDPAPMWASRVQVCRVLGLQIWLVGSQPRSSGPLTMRRKRLSTEGTVSGTDAIGWLGFWSGVRWGDKGAV